MQKRERTIVLSNAEQKIILCKMLEIVSVDSMHYLATLCNSNWKMIKCMVKSLLGKSQLYALLGKTWKFLKPKKLRYRIALGKAKID